MAREEIHRMAQERDISHLPLLVFASKSDLNTAQATVEPGATEPSGVSPWTKEELWEALEMDKVEHKAKEIIVRRWVSCSRDLRGGSVA
jgi:hypothetical protein